MYDEETLELGRQTSYSRLNKGIKDDLRESHVTLLRSLDRLPPSAVTIQ